MHARRERHGPVLVLLPILWAAIGNAATRIQLQPVMTGLSDPLFVTNAHDGSNRLFVLEQAGRIKVLQPGTSAATVFLDIRDKVLSGGERGLLGLAFHPQYSSNGRFFVDYTRRPDGATIIAEYSVSGRDPNSADPTETVLLIIAQPFANHNGGMVEFGQDGFLYIGMGDGGSGNDPDNHAQNPNDLLGKILRIDVDRHDAGISYAIPSGNPFVSAGNGRGEVYALGLRNPFRFSFDRVTGDLFAGDVGQDVIEEIDRITLGGNYGWRVLEGDRCTGLGPAACSAPEFIPPLTEYSHENGRCAVTGGYVYRGSQASLPFGTYVFADFCTGEIFLLRNGTQTLLLANENRRISSFGEDESGEIYVTGLDTGTVDRIVNPDAPVFSTFHFPRLVTASASNNGPEQHTGFAVTNPSDAAATLKFTAFNAGGGLISGAAITNPRTLELKSGEQLALIDTEIFGAGLQIANRAGWVGLESSRSGIAPFFLGFDSALSSLDGGNAPASGTIASILPEMDNGAVQVNIANPHTDITNTLIQLNSADGVVRASITRPIPPQGTVAESVADIFAGTAPNPSDFVRVNSDQPVVAFEYVTRPGQDSRGLVGQDATAGALTLYAPQYAVGGPYVSRLSIVNLESVQGTVKLRLMDDQGNPIGDIREESIKPSGKLLVDDPGFFLSAGSGVIQGYVEISSNVRVTGSVQFTGQSGTAFSTSLPLVSKLLRRFAYSQLASNSTYFTGITLVNPNGVPADVVLEVFDSSGNRLQSAQVAVGSGGRRAALITEVFPELAAQDLNAGYIRVTSDQPLASFVVFGTNTLSVLSGISAR